MAKEIVVKSKIDGIKSVEEQIGAFNKLNKSLKETRAEMLKVKEGGKLFKALADEANALKEKMNDLKDATTIQGSGVEKLTASFGLLTEGMQNADFTKIKTGFAGLKASMSALPIFALVQGIQLLIENFDVVVDVFKSFTDAAKEQAADIRSLNTAYNELAGNLDEIAFRGENLMKGIDQRNKLAIESAKQRGATEKEINQIEVDGNKKKYDLLTKVEENYRKQKEFADSQLTKAYKSGTDKEIETAKQLLDKATNLHKESRTKMQDFNNELVVNEAKSLTTSIENQRAANKKALEDYKRTQKEKYDAYKLANEKAIDSTRESNEIIKKIEADDSKKIFDAKRKADDAEFAQELNKRAERKALLKLSTQDKLDALTEQKNITLSNTELTEQKRVEIIRKYNEDVAKLHKESLNATLNNFNQLTTAVASVANNVVGVFASAIALMQQNRNQELAEFNKDIEAKVAGLEEQKAYELSKENLTNKQKQAIQDKYARAEYELRLQQYNAETAIKKKAFEQDKKLKIAQTVISTITGAVSALVSAIASSIPYPYNIVAGVISAAAVAASGAIQIAQIKAQKFDAGTPPSPPKLGGATSTGSDMGSNSAKAGYTPNELQKVGGNGSGEGDRTGNTEDKKEPQKVYVVANDITNQQNKDAILERRATY
jgi:hypothetical protein